MARVNAEPGRKRPIAAGRLLTLALAAFLFTLLAEALCAGAGSFVVVSLGALGFGSTAVFAATASVRSVRALTQRNVDALAGGTNGRPVNVAVAVLGLLMTGVGVWATWFATVGFARGRQMRRLGRLLLPPVEPSDSWLDVNFNFSLEGTHEVPVGLGQQWRENGRTEHASVASFARLTLDLMVLGAPPSLVHAANRDAADEIRHAEACFALAHALDGRAEGPAPFPDLRRADRLPRARTLALAELAVLSLIDGALHEGVSARVIAKLARRCQQPAICRTLKQIAADEGRHAAHGWEIVEWCLVQGGVAVAHALRGALHALPTRIHSTLPEAARSGAWEAWGVQGQQLESEEYTAARADLVQRVLELLEPERASAVAS